MLGLVSHTFAVELSADEVSASIMTNSYRFQQGGWTYVHLEGTPAEIGYQHGYLLAPEIADNLAARKLSDTYYFQRG